MRVRVHLVLVLFALVPAGCGDGGEERSGEGTAAQKQSAERGQDDAEQQGEGQNGNEPARVPTPAEPDPPIATERVPGSKAVAPGVPVTKGGDNSIQAFGSEGETSEADQALAAFDAYMRARIAGDWQGACGAASEEFRGQLEALIDRAKAKGGAEKPEGCAETLGLLAGSAPTARLDAVAEVTRLLSFRVREDGYAYLIYEDGARVVRFIAMARGEGGWRVNTVEAGEFSS